MAETKEKQPEGSAHRTAAKGSPGAGFGGKPKGFDAKETRVRDEFVGRLLDRGATRQQVIDALRRSVNPGRDQFGNPVPPGLGLRPVQAKKAFEGARRRRAAAFREEAQFAREEQSARLRGHISGAAADKQYTAVASLERGYARLHGTDAPRRAVARHGDRRALIADILADLSDEQVRELADEDDTGDEDE